MKNVYDMTRDELRAEAKELQIPGRGSMKAWELREAVQASREEARREQAKEIAAMERLTGWTEVGTTDGGGRIFIAPMPPRRDRYRDRVKRGELKVRTPNGQAPELFIGPVGPIVRNVHAPGRAEPMPTQARIMHYVKQNGTHRLTPRQERQVERMDLRMRWKALNAE